ncbi:hypothetical protein D3C87_1036970 [compost metagenome]
MIFLVVVLLSCIPFLFLMKNRRGEMANSAILFFAAAYVFYAGYCIGDDAIPAYYVWMYFAFIIAFCVSYNFTFKVFKGLGASAEVYYNDFFSKFFRRRIRVGVIFCYISLSLIPLIYPEFKLGLLLNPPEPDLAGVFGVRFEVVETNAFVSLASLMKQLLTPFFYISLFGESRKGAKQLLLLALVFYLEYVASGYKSRGQLIVSFFPVLFYFWCTFPKKRFVIALCGVALLPFVMLLFSFYEIYRLDSSASVSEFGVWSSVDHILRTETGFVEFVGVPLIQSKAYVDLWLYMQWIVTLPIPKFIIGEVAGARINTEISEIILGAARGSQGFYIVLPGLIAEANYIYGPFFFWVHAATLGVLFAFLFRMFGTNPRFTFLVGYIVGLAAYNLNRGGIASFLPLVVNQLFLMYFIYLAYKLRLIALTQGNIALRGNA